MYFTDHFSGKMHKICIAIQTTDYFKINLVIAPLAVVKTGEEILCLELF